MTGQNKKRIGIILAVTLCLVLTGCVNWMEKSFQKSVKEQSVQASTVYKSADKYLIKVNPEDQYSEKKIKENEFSEIKLPDDQADGKKGPEVVDIIPEADDEKKNLPMGSNRESKEDKIPIVINLEDATLNEFLDILVLDFLNASYVVEARPSVKISLNLQGEFSKTDMEITLKTVLESLKLTLAKHGGVYHVISAQNVAGLGDNMKLLVRSPKYVNAENIIALAKDIKSNAGKLSTIYGSNILYMYDYPEIISRVDDLVTAFDVPFFKDRFARIYTIKNAYAPDLVKEIEDLLNRYNLFSKKQKVAAEVISLERIQKIVILTSSREALAYFDSWMEILDQKEDYHRSLYSYMPRYMASKDIVAVLNKVFPAKDDNDRPSLKAFEDEKSNLVIIRAPREIYHQARELIKEIDIPPRQVYIQALLAEIRLTDEMKMGFQWWLTDQIKDKSIALGSTIGDITSEIFRFQITADKFYALFSNMIKENDASIIATPHILVQNKEDASIEIKREVPVIKSFITSDVTSDGSSAEQPSIEYKDAGIILKVNPDIVNSNELKLTIEQEVSSPSQVSLLGDLQTYEFSTRKVSTDIFLKSNETILIGGLLSQENSSGNDKIPGFGDIPFMNVFFSAKSEENQRIELVLFLTPIVINHEDNLEEFTKEMAALLSSNGLKTKQSYTYGR